jgi:integrase
MRFPRAVAGKLPITAIAEKWNPPPMLADQVAGVAVLVALVAGTGLRIGEALAIRTDDFDPLCRLLQVRRSV